MTRTDWRNIQGLVANMGDTSEKLNMIVDEMDDMQDPIHREIEYLSTQEAKTKFERAKGQASAYILHLKNVVQALEDYLELTEFENRNF